MNRHYQVGAARRPPAAACRTGQQHAMRPHHDLRVQAACRGMQHSMEWCGIARPAMHGRGCDPAAYCAAWLRLSCSARYILHVTSCRLPGCMDILRHLPTCSKRLTTRSPCSSLRPLLRCCMVAHALPGGQLVCFAPAMFVFWATCTAAPPLPPARPPCLQPRLPCGRG
jgi:hypothetical protein